MNSADLSVLMDIHRVRNDLYSATLTLRAIAMLLDQGEVERARQVAINALEKLEAMPPESDDPESDSESN